jgi:hypothetical protein
MNTKSKIGLKFLRNYLFNKSRPLPDFIILGCQKGGTSSLFEYLQQHPAIVGSFIKEVQFFTTRHWVGNRGYRAFFPKSTAAGNIAMEATPYYLFSYEAPERAAAMLPQTTKFAALLREPVSRAYSHYKHNVRRGHETRTFEDAVAADMAMSRKSGTLARSPAESELEYRHFSYLRRGLYQAQLDRWMDFFPRENFFIGKAEDLFADPSAVTKEVLDFLGLPQRPIGTDQAHNQYSYTRKSKDQFPELCEFFREPNERLMKSTGIGWK